MVPRYILEKLIRDGDLKTMASQSGSPNISPPAAKIRITPTGFHMYAEQFLAADQSSQQGKGFSPVPYYLVCRSIELTLKAFLLAERAPIDEIKRKIGHNLVKALDKAKAKGLGNLVNVDANVEKEIENANHYYKNKEFEYFEFDRMVTGYPRLPDLETLRPFAAELVDKLRQHCRDAT